MLDPAEATPTTAATLPEPRYTPVLRRALGVALLVGTCLMLLNQGDVLAAAILQGTPPTGALFWKSPLTYAVPFLVSWYSSVAAMKSRD